jgi:hypothetical protein
VSLIKSGSKKSVGKNIKEMVSSGYPVKQAVAASLSNARKYGVKRASKSKKKEPMKHLGDTFRIEK